MNLVAGEKPADVYSGIAARYAFFSGLQLLEKLWALVFVKFSLFTI